MGVSWKLALNYLKNNKKRTYILSACIIISTILITAILLLIDSYRECQISSIRQKANWEVGYNGITYEEACTLEKHTNVKEISVICDKGIIKSESNINLNNINIDTSMKLVGYDNNALKNLVKNNITEGRLPENSSEIVCDENIVDFKTGETITQKLENGETKEYVIVGKINGMNIPSYSSDQFITLLDRNKLKNDDRVNITILSNNIKQIYDDYFDIYYMLDSYRNEKGSSLDNMTTYNIQLLEYSNVLDYTSQFQQNIYVVESVFIGIIVIASVAFIYSVINISIVERKRYFGILKSIGTTTKQMKRSIRIELLIILVITIPLGILIGIWLDWALIRIINNLLPEYATSYSIFSSLFEVNEEMKVAVPISTLGMSILIIIFTVYFSSIIPIRKVSNLQAINMIKNNKEKQKFKKTRKQLKATKHIERKLACKNVERYKIRYSAIIMSLIISIALIIVSNYYIGSITANTYKSDYNYRIALDYSSSKYENLTEKIIDDIQEENIAKKLISVNPLYYMLLVNKQNISDTEKDFSKKIYNGKENLFAHYDVIFNTDNYDISEILDTYYLNITIITLNEDAYNEYLQELGIDKPENNECILVDYLPEKTKYYDGIRLTNYNEGEEITLRSSMPGYASEDELKEYSGNLKIKKITDKIPNNLYAIENKPLIITNDEAIQNLYEQMYGESDPYNSYKTIVLQVTDIEETNTFVKSLQEKYNLTDNEIGYHELTTQEEIDSSELLRNIFIYSFIGIITLIGLLNMSNAINTSLEVRKREIVSLITVGMEQKQINKMLFIENAICGILSLLLGITIGLAISYIIYRNNINYIIYNFQIPWVAIIISIIAIVIITILATIYLKSKIASENLIDILKKEDI